MEACVFKSNCKTMGTGPAKSCLAMENAMFSMPRSSPLQRNALLLSLHLPAIAASALKATFSVRECSNASNVLLELFTMKAALFIA